MKRIDIIMAVLLILMPITVGIFFVMVCIGSPRVTPDLLILWEMVIAANIILYAIADFKKQPWL